MFFTVMHIISYLLYGTVKKGALLLGHAQYFMKEGDYQKLYKNLIEQRKSCRYVRVREFVEKVFEHGNKDFLETQNKDLLAKFKKERGKEIGFNINETQPISQEVPGKNIGLLHGPVPVTSDGPYRRVSRAGRPVLLQ